MHKGKKVLVTLNILVGIFTLLLIIFLGYYFFNDIMKLDWSNAQEELIEKIKSTGPLGIIILIIVQFFQVVVAFIPGEFVEIAAGAMFGPIIGLVLCLIGLNLGTIFIFYVVRKLGKPFLDQLDKKGHYSKLKFLEDPIRAQVILFFFFLIPGPPKDLLIYPIPLTRIRCRNFLILSSIARIPSIITSTMIGASIINSNYQMAIITSAIMFVISVIGLIFNKQICDYIENIIKNRQIKE